MALSIRFKKPGFEHLSGVYRRLGSPMSQTWKTVDPGNETLARELCKYNEDFELSDTKATPAQAPPPDRTRFLDKRAGEPPDEE